MIDDDVPARERRISPWAESGMVFAACTLTLIGAFEVIAGLTAIIDDDFFVVTRNYTFDLDTTAWGWIHLILGAFALATGLGLIAGKMWAVAWAIVISVFSAIASFFFIPYYPLWSIVVIALDVWVIWALSKLLDER